MSSLGRSLYIVTTTNHGVLRSFLLSVVEREDEIAITKYTTEHKCTYCMAVDRVNLL